DTVVASPLVSVALQWAGQMQFISDRSDSASLGGIVISRAQLQSLPPEQQAMVREVTAQFNALLGRNVTRDDEQAVQVLAQRGVQVVTLNEGERAQWAQLFTRVRGRLAGAIADAAYLQRVERAGRGQ